MPTWRLAGAETLIVGDALVPLLPADAAREPDERIAVEALRGAAIVRVGAADIVPPGLAVRAVLAPERAAYAEVRLSLLGRGDVRRVVWVVESGGRLGRVRRAVDAYSGLVLSDAPGDVTGGPAAIVLTRRRTPEACDLVTWSRCVLGLPLSVELDPPVDGGTWCRLWQGVVRGPRPTLAV